MKTPLQIGENKKLNLQTLIVLLIFFLVVISIVIANIFVSQFVENRTKDILSDKIRDIARIAAHSDTVIEGLQGERPLESLQEYATETLSITEAGFVVILNMDLIRLSHPLVEEIGQPFYNLKDAQPALQGEEYITFEKGPLGMGMRIFTPVYDDRETQIGIVVVGISLDTVEEQIALGQRMINMGFLIQLAIGAIGAFFLSRYIKRTLFGLEPAEIAQILTERNMMLESVKEGIIAVNREGEITLINKEALRLMNVPLTQDIIGEHIEDYIPIFAQVIRTGKPEANHEQEFFGRTILVNSAPILVNERVVGGIATFRDKTEIDQLSEQLTGVKNYSEALRARSHEFKNKLHVILGMLHMKKYQELEKFIPTMVESYQNEIDYIVQRIKHPAFAGFLLGKISKARELGIGFSIDRSSSLPEEISDPMVHDLITVAGTLIENAYEAVRSEKQNQVSFFILQEDSYLFLEVSDTGAGIPEQNRQQIFHKGFSTKGENRGYGLFLLKQAVEKYHGDFSIESKTEKGTVIKVKMKIPHEETE